MCAVCMLSSILMIVLVTLVLTRKFNSAACRSPSFLARYVYSICRSTCFASNAMLCQMLVRKMRQTECTTAKLLYIDASFSTAVSKKIPSSAAAEVQRFRALC